MPLSYEEKLAMLDSADLAVEKAMLSHFKSHEASRESARLLERMLASPDAHPLERDYAQRFLPEVRRTLARNLIDREQMLRTRIAGQEFRASLVAEHEERRRSASGKDPERPEWSEDAGERDDS